MELLPRLVFEAALADAEAGEGFAVAIAPGGAVVFQLALSERGLRACTEERPPSCTMAPEAAIALALDLLRVLRPGLVEQLEIAERRAGLRVVRGDGPEAA